MQTLPARIVALAILLGSGSAAQEPAERLEFEVASIKENREPIQGGFIRYVPSGAVTGRHMAARGFVTAAYGLKSYLLVGAPEWTRTTYYDLNARPSGTATRQQQLAMLRSLLADRFGFSAHREMRALDGYALQRVRAERLGPNLRPSSLDCLAGRDAAGVPIPGFAPPPRCLEGTITSNNYRMSGFSVTQFASMIDSTISAPIDDETGLSGPFDIDLRWSTDAAPIDDVPGLFTALQEQLGLKLEPRKLQRDVLVVDRMERATPD
jgi:uncharacterized protein (TIGR03435 family)